MVSYRMRQTTKTANEKASRLSGMRMASYGMRQTT